MATDILTTITELINSPPGQLLAGGVLAGIVWKFFERVEAVLTDQTKLEIAVWLLGRKKFGPRVQPWPDTFAKVFDRVFGAKHISWKCFWRCLLVSYAVFALALTFALLFSSDWNTANVGSVRFLMLFVIVLFTNVIPDYLSLLETRFILNLMIRWKRVGVIVVLLIIDLSFTVYFGSIGASALSHYHEDVIIVQGMEKTYGHSMGWWWEAHSVLGWAGSQVLYPITHPLYAIHETIVGNLGVVTEHIADMNSVGTYAGLKVGRPIVFGSCVTSIWLWLYAGSGFLLKAARRFDIGFDWFNRKFDIEKKPLQSIGLVAGALVAVAYWTAVIVSRVIG